MSRNASTAIDSPSFEPADWEMLSEVAVTEEVGQVPTFSDIDVILLRLNLNRLGHHRQAA